MVEETLEAGASVAKVALKYGVNANQVFQWRRLYRDGKLGGVAASAVQVLPVSVVEEKRSLQPVEWPAPNPCAIHIELPGDIRICLEGSVDQDLVRTALKSLGA